MKSLLNKVSSRLILKEFLPESDVIESWAAVNIILSFIEGRLCVAMIKRAENPLDPWSGHYAFPGGRLEENESRLEAANRETNEEIGLSLDNPLLAFEFLSFQMRYENKNLPYGVCAHIHLIQKIKTHFTIDPDEVAAAYWLPLNQFLVKENFQEKSLGRGSDLYPCITFDGHTIWGLSYFMLYELLIQLEGISWTEEGMSYSLGTKHLRPFSYHRP